MGSPHWLMTESRRAPHSPFRPPTSPLERGEIYQLITGAASQASPSYAVNIEPQPLTPQGEKVKSLNMAFVLVFFFPLSWSQRWKTCTCQSQLQLFYCCDILLWCETGAHAQAVKALPAGFPMGDGNHCSIYCYVFADFSSHKTNPKQPKTKMEREENIYKLISGEEELVNTDSPCFKSCNVQSGKTTVMKTYKILVQISA